MAAQQIEEKPLQIGDEPTCGRVPKLKFEPSKKKDIEKIQNMGFCYVGKSEVGCFHRPSHHQIRIMRDIQKVSLIVTV